MVNLEHIRKNIILKNGVHYFDYTASGLGFQDIENELLNILKTYANTHSDSSSNAIITQNLYETARDELKDLLELDDSFYLFPCGFGSTSAIKKFQEILGLYIPPATKKRYSIQAKNKPLVIIGPYEHHSNEVSFREGLCDVVRVGICENGDINLKELEQVLILNQKREIIASFSVCSNVTGIISDYKAIYEIVKRYGGIVALDAASYSAYKNVDCRYFDALFLSPHKLVGGVGSCGILVLKKELYSQNEPTFAGGGTVSYVSRNSHLFVNEPEQLEQGGTPPILQLLKANLAYKLRNSIGFDTICENELELGEYFEKQITQIKDIKLYSPLNLKRLPIFSFNVKDISPYDLTALLSNDFGIQTRAGCACAGPYGHELLGLKDNAIFGKKPGWVRVSIHYTHTFDDIDFLINAIKSSIEKYHSLWAEERSMYALMREKG